MSSTSSFTTPSSIDGMLSTRDWLVVGDVLNQSKPSGKVVQKLLSHQRRVWCVNPRLNNDSNGSIPVWKNLNDAIRDARKGKSSPDSSFNSIQPAKELILNLIINSKEGFNQLNSISNDELPISVWIQPGAESEEIFEICKKKNFPIHEGCVLISKL
jgi:predicted CoA-binding protein